MERTKGKTKGKTARSYSGVVQRTPKNAVEGQVTRFRDNKQRLRYKQYVKSPITGKLVTKYVGRKAFDEYNLSLDPNYVPAPSRGGLEKGSDAARTRMAELRALRKTPTLETREKSAAAPTKAKIVKLLKDQGINPTKEATKLLLDHIKSSGAHIIDRVIQHCMENEIKKLKHTHLEFLGNRVRRKRKAFTQDEE